MNTAMQIFSNPDFGDMRVLGDYDNPLFCLADVCRILGLEVNNVVRRLDDGVCSKHPIIDSLGRQQTATFITEGGLYDVILDSRKPAAKRFRKWVTCEVVPSIRKHGVYATQDFLAKSIADPAWAIGLLTELKNAQEQNALLKVQNAELQPKADYCDVILQCKELVPTSVIAKDYGFSARHFNKLLHELSVQYKQGEMWLLYQQYAGRGWTQTRTHKYMGSDEEIHCKTHTYWTQKGRLGLYHFLKERGFLPLIEH